MLFLLSTTVFAQSGARLLEGTPEFESCLSSETCTANFYAFLGEAMAEQGYTMQHNALNTSAAVNEQSGWVAGATISTFPFAPPRENLSGKEENSSFSPVLPRLEFGRLDSLAGLHVGAGMFFLPPIPVQGASAAMAGVDLSAAKEIGPLSLGGELDGTWVRARAPVVASEQQYENRDSFDNPSNLSEATYEAVCVPAPNGCVDTFTLLSSELRFVARVSVGHGVARFSPFLKLGLAYVQERLWVMYDDTLWGISGVQPGAQMGTGWMPHERVFLAASASVAYKPEQLSTSDGAGAFFKLEGGASVRF